MDKSHKSEQAEDFSLTNEDWSGRIVVAEENYIRVFGKDPLPFPDISDEKYALLLEKCVMELKPLIHCLEQDEDDYYSIFDRQSERWL